MTSPLSFKLRISLPFLILLVLFSVIIARLFQLQVLEADRLKQIARKQHKKTIVLYPKRGTIFDRSLKEMVISLETMSVYAHPSRIGDKRTAARLLSKALGIRYDAIKRRLSSRRSFVWLKRELSDKEVKVVKDLGIKGIGMIKESKRVYVEPCLAANVIGFAGRDSQGLEGIEFYYDGYLKGEKGFIQTYKDAYGRAILYDGIYKKDPSQGFDMVLTIDRNIQYIAERELRGAVVRYNAKGGIVIVMDPKTGEILAMANMPTFDPNDLSSYSPKEWRNRAIADAFEPGSTFKVFLAAAALESGRFSPNTIFYGENGKYRISNRVIHDYKEFGWLSLAHILKYSSNIGAVKVGERLGKDAFYQTIRGFGFGEKTGIDLPGESSGILRDGNSWSRVRTATISFGQGVSVTAIQLITAISAIANGGYLLKPYVVKRIVSKDGSVVKEFAPWIKRRVISEKTSRLLTSMLEKVTDRDGTGFKASLDQYGYKVAGKTGTAQKVNVKDGGYYKDRYISSFIGYLPSDDPKLSILVVIDEPKGEFYGGEVAAPVFKRIAEEVLPYMGVLPQDASIKEVHVKIERKGIEIRDSKKDISNSKYVKKIVDKEGFSLPSFVGKTMREALQQGWSLSLNLHVVGSGRVVSQEPVPGSHVKIGDSVTIYLKDTIEKNNRVVDNGAEYS